MARSLSAGRRASSPKKRLLFQLNLPLRLTPFLSVILAMALDSLPLYPGGDLGSSRATRSHQRIGRKEERSWTKDTYAPYDDGHQWRKYGEKKLSNSSFPRFYYRCTYKNEMKCAATKQVQQKDASDPPLFSVTYFNHHICSTSTNPTIGSTRDAAAPQSSSSKKKAVSICFSSHSSSGQQQPTFLTSAPTPVSPSIQSYYRDSQQLDRDAHARQFQWTNTSCPTINSPVMKMEEVGNFSEAAGASSSSSTTGAPSSTLLPIGQSRCIEYFHFL